MASLRFNSSAPSNNAQSNDSWKAAGFINLYLPGGKNGTTKLGAIPLKLANADEKRMFDWLKANQPFEVEYTDEKGKPQKKNMLPLEWLAANLTMDFREASTDGTRFALPGGNPPF